METIFVLIFFGIMILIIKNQRDKIEELEDEVTYLKLKELNIVRPQFDKSVSHSINWIDGEGE